MELPRRRVPEYVLACHLPAPRVDEYPGPASRSRTCSRSRPFPPCGVASVADAWPCCRSENYIPSQLTSRQSERGPRCRQIFPTARHQPPRLERLRLRYSRSEEHTSELQSLMRISYAVFCLKNTTKIKQKINNNT